MLAVDLEKKIGDLEDYTKSWVPTLQNGIEQEKAERKLSIQEVEKNVAYNKDLTDNKLEELQYKIDMIIKFLNANIFISNYGENAFDKWAGISQ